MPQSQTSHKIYDWNNQAVSSSQLVNLQRYEYKACWIVCSAEPEVRIVWEDIKTGETWDVWDFANIRAAWRHLKACFGVEHAMRYMWSPIPESARRQYGD